MRGGTGCRGCRVESTSAPWGAGIPGATNVWRTRSGSRIRNRRIALLDINKGAAAALLGLWVGGDLVGVLAGVAAMIGHWRPLFLGFARGGKMVATTGGVALAVAPLPALAAAAVWIVVFFPDALRLGRVDPRGGLAALGARLRCLLAGRGVHRRGALAIIVLHRTNVRRLHGRRGRIDFTARASALGLEAVAPDPAPPLESRLRAPK